MNGKKSLMKRDWKIVDQWKYYFLISGLIIVLGIVLLCIPKIGLNLGIDFEGGYSMEIQYGGTLNRDNYDEKLAVVEKVVNNLKDEQGKPYNLEVSRAQMQGEAEGASILIRFKAIGDEDYMETVTERLRSALIDELNDSESPYVGNVKESSSISQTVSSELLFAAIAAIYLSLLLMLVYITIRFEFKSGLSAVVALLHDVLIVISFMVFTRIEINSTFIAAIITLIGYSINNTVIIFDRVRENHKNPANAELSPKEIANMSVKDSFWRTFNSSLTTLFTITLLAIIGVSAIREFALPIIMGLLSGIYSSLCIAPSVWTLLQSGKKKVNKEKKDDNSSETITAA